MPTFDLDELIKNTTSGHSKFWRGQRIGDMVYVTYGRIGAAKPQRRADRHPTPAAADRYIRQAAYKKRKEGYVMVLPPESNDRVSYPDCTPILPPDASTQGSTPQPTTPPPPSVPVRGTATRGLDLD